MYKNHKIGIAVPNYNNGRFCSDAIKSLVTQSVLPDVVCIVDDGSTDNSIAKIKEAVSGLELTFKVVLLQLNKNSGPSAARNVAFNELINTEKCWCVGLLDMDDIYYGGKIRASVDVLDEHPSIGMVSSDYITRAKDGNKSRVYVTPYSFSLLEKRCSTPGNSFLRSSVALKVGAYSEDVRYGEDYDYWLRLSEHACICNIPEALWEYRMHDSNTTVVTDRSTYDRDVIKVIERMNKRRGYTNINAN